MYAPGRRLRDGIDRIAASSPARLAMLSFVGVIAVFTVLLCLPIAHQNPSNSSFAVSLFTAVSAVCVTGLTPEVISEYWSNFGISVILAAVQVGGLGILTLASVLGLAVSRKLGLRQRLIAAQATNTFQLGQVGTLLRVVVTTIVVVESIVFVLLFPRFLMRGEGLGNAAWHSLFYSISSFNNAGFALHPDGMEYFAQDPWILIVIMLSVFVGALGFPVVLMMALTWRHPARWDLHTKLTLTTSAILVGVGFVLLLLFEAGNPKTLGAHGFWMTIVETLFMAVMPRSSGFSTVNVPDMAPSSHLLLDVLMFIGGGSSSTAGGIKVTTLAVLVLAAFSEARGLRDVSIFHRRIDPSVIKVAISVTLAGFVFVITGTLIMLQVTKLQLDMVLFEVISAFGTCGLSSGVSAHSPPPGLFVLSVLMLVGRLGTITLAAAVSTRDTPLFYRYPEERPIIG